MRKISFSFFFFSSFVSIVADSSRKFVLFFSSRMNLFHVDNFILVIKNRKDERDGHNRENLYRCIFVMLKFYTNKNI